MAFTKDRTYTQHQREAIETMNAYLATITDDTERLRALDVITKVYNCGKREGEARLHKKVLEGFARMLENNL